MVWFQNPYWWIYFRPLLQWMILLQPLRWYCVDCVIYHERDVREEQHHTYIWHEQAIIEWSWHVNSVVACCHSAKLCAHAARGFWSQHSYCGHSILIQNSYNLSKWNICVFMKLLFRGLWFIQETWVELMKGLSHTCVSFFIFDPWTTICCPAVFWVQCFLLSICKPVHFSRFAPLFSCRTRFLTTLNLARATRWPCL